MLAGIPQTPKSFPWDLRDSRKRQKVFRGTCGTPAKAKKFLGALAGLPQRPKSFPGDLRDSRKHQKVSRETCETPANTSKKFLGFAAFLQKCFSLFWRLQDFCKDAFPHFGVCRSSCKHNKSPTRAFVRLCRGFFLKVGQILSLSNPPTPEGPPYRGTPYTSMLTSRSPYARNRP